MHACGNMQASCLCPCMHHGRLDGLLDVRVCIYICIYVCMCTDIRICGLRYHLKWSLCLNMYMYRCVCVSVCVYIYISCWEFRHVRICTYSRLCLRSRGYLRQGMSHRWIEAFLRNLYLTICGLMAGWKSGIALEQDHSPEPPNPATTRPNP